MYLKSKTPILPIAISGAMRPLEEDPSFIIQAYQDMHRKPLNSIMTQRPGKPDQDNSRIKGQDH